MHRIQRAINAYRLARFFGFPVHIAMRGAFRKLTETKKGTKQNQPITAERNTNE